MKKTQYFKWVANDLTIDWCYTEKEKIQLLFWQLNVDDC